MKDKIYKLNFINKDNITHKFSFAKTYKETAARLQITLSKINKFIF